MSNVGKTIVVLPQGTYSLSITAAYNRLVEADRSANVAGLTLDTFSKGGITVYDEIVVYDEAHWPKIDITDGPHQGKPKKFYHHLNDKHNRGRQ